MNATVPKYVISIIEGKRLQLAPIDEQIEAKGAYGYAFRLYRISNSSGALVNEAERLTAWAERMGAESKVIRYKWFTDKEHRKPFYKRDYALLLITDPVAQHIERQNEKVNLRRT